MQDRVPPSAPSPPAQPARDLAQRSGGDRLAEPPRRFRECPRNEGELFELRERELERFTRRIANSGSDEQRAAIADERARFLHNLENRLGALRRRAQDRPEPRSA